MDNKEYISKLFDKVSEDLSVQTVQPAKENNDTSVMATISRLIDDYNEKIGLNIKLSGSLELSDIAKKPNGMAFMRRALDAAKAFDKCSDSIRKLLRQDKDLWSDLFIPVFSLSALLASEINGQVVVPELDISAFDRSRFGTAYDEVLLITEEVKKIVQNTKEAWIMFMCFDLCAMLNKNICTMAAGDDVIKSMILSLTIIPYFSRASRIFASSMVEASRDI